MIVSLFYSILDTTTVHLIMLIELSSNEDIVLDFAGKAVGSDHILLD